MTFDGLTNRSAQRLLLAAGVTLFTLAIPAAAQKPSDGADIVRQMHDRYVGKWYHTLTFTQATTRRTAADTLVHETWYESMSSPGSLRIDIGAKGGDNYVLFTRDSTFRHRGTQPIVRNPGRNELLILGFDVYTQPVEKTVSQLREEGFDLSKTYETTWEGHPTYVVGALAGDSTSKQFWVDRDRMLFVRILEPSSRSGSGTFDIRFERYKQYGSAWVSEFVSMTSAGKLIQSEEYTNIMTNPALDPGMFNPDKP